MDKRITIEQRRAIKAVRRSARRVMADNTGASGDLWPFYGNNGSRMVREVKRYR